MLKSVLNDHSYDYIKTPGPVSVLAVVTGNGIFSAEGDLHKFQRKHMTPSFHLKKIHDFYPTFWKRSCQLVDRLRAHAHEPEIEIGIWSTRITLDLIGLAGFGHDFDSLRKGEDPFAASFEELGNPTVGKRTFFFMTLACPLWIPWNIPFWSVPRGLKRTAAYLRQCGSAILQARRSALSMIKGEATSQNNNDLLALLIKSNNFNEEELIDHVLTIMSAGHETTASTLCWALFLLANDTKTQAELRDEIRAACPSPSEAFNNTPSAHTLESLPLLSAVCAETLRLYPAANLTGRVNPETIALGSVTLPADTAIFLPISAYNRLSTFWGPDAQLFRPQRWLDVSVSPDGKQTTMFNNHGGAKSNYHFMTFLHGPRSCLGMPFARAELRRWWGRWTLSWPAPRRRLCLRA